MQQVQQQRQRHQLFSLLAAERSMGGGCSFDCKKRTFPKAEAMAPRDEWAVLSPHHFVRSFGLRATWSFKTPDGGVRQRPLRGDFGGRHRPHGRRFARLIVGMMGEHLWSFETLRDFSGCEAGDNFAHPRVRREASRVALRVATSLPQISDVSMVVCRCSAVGRCRMLAGESMRPSRTSRRPGLSCEWTTRGATRTAMSWMSSTCLWPLAQRLPDS